MQMYPSHTHIQFETASEKSDLFTVLCGQWDSIQNSQLIREYKEIPVQLQIYRYLVVKNGNFTFLLTSSGQNWQFHISTDI